jgi:hypothetical protein
MTRRPRDEAAAERLGRVYDRFAGVMYRYALMILAAARKPCRYTPARRPGAATSAFGFRTANLQ